MSEGEIFGFLGPNGSGKTTLFKILSTLISPTSGKAEIFGLDVAERSDEVRSLIGAVFQNPSLDSKLTVSENLLHQGHLYGIWGSELKDKMNKQMEKFGVSDRADEFVENLSGGLKRRVELAKAFINRPKLLILDEPSTGLDPGARRNLWDTLVSLREEEGITVVVTTHLAEEAERCDRVTVMNDGELIVTGTPEALKSEIGGDVITVSTLLPDELMANMREKFGGDPIVVNGDVRIELKRGHEFIPQLVEAFPGKISAVKVGKPTLEDVFVHHTGRSFYMEGKELN